LLSSSSWSIGRIFEAFFDLQKILQYREASFGKNGASAKWLSLYLFIFQGGSNV